jgi:hypothetical protein
MKIILCLIVFLSCSLAIAKPAGVCKMQNQLVITPPSTIGTLALAANVSRACLVVQNTSGSALNVYVKTGTTIVTTEGILLQQYGSWEPTNVPRDAVYIKAASGSPTVYIMEGN